MEVRPKRGAHPARLREWCAARGSEPRAAALVPLGLLGCKVETSLRSKGGAYHGDTYTIGQLVSTCGGAPLQTLHLDESMFGPTAMAAGGELSFEAMKLPQLKEVSSPPVALRGRG